MRLNALVFLCPPSVGDEAALANLVAQVKPVLAGRTMVIYQPRADSITYGPSIADALGVTWRELRNLLGEPVSGARDDQAITCVTEGRETDNIVLVVSPEWVARVGKRIVEKVMSRRAHENIPTLQAGQAHIVQ